MNWHIYQAVYVFPPRICSLLHVRSCTVPRTRDGTGRGGGGLGAGGAVALGALVYCRDGGALAITLREGGGAV